MTEQTAEERAAFRAYLDSVLGPRRDVWRLEAYRDYLREKAAGARLHCVQNELDAQRVEEYLDELKKEDNQE